MIGTLSLILIFLVFWWYLVEYIKYFKTGDPEERDHNYWKFSYNAFTHYDNYNTINELNLGIKKI